MLLDHGFVQRIVNEVCDLQQYRGPGNRGQTENMLWSRMTSAASKTDRNAVAVSGQHLQCT